MIEPICIRNTGVQCRVKDIFRCLIGLLTILDKALEANAEPMLHISCIITAGAELCQKLLN